MRRAWALGVVLAVGVLGGSCALSPPMPTAGSREAPPARIRGTVKDARGTVAGAKVLLSVTQAGESLSARPCPWDSRRPLLDCSRPDPLVPELVARRAGEAAVLARTLSAADGSFSLEAPRTGLASLWVESPEGVALRRDVRAGDTVHLALEPGVGVSGVVGDGAGATVAGARVTAVHKAHSRFFETVTDATGHYALGPLPHGPYVVVVTQEGMVPEQRDVLGLLPTLPLDLYLEHPRRVSGVVLLGGVPVAGARVTTIDRGEDIQRQALTDARGHFALEGLEPRWHYVLQATHAGHKALLDVDFREVEGPERTGLSLALEPAASVRGTVRDAAGQPLAQARVEVARWVARGFLSQVAGVQTDAQGQYAVDDLTPGPFRIAVRAQGQRAPEPRELELPEGTSQADFTLSPATLVEGVLVDPEGQPFADEPMTLRASGSSESFAATSGADGHFVFTQASPGRYQLELAREKYQGRSLGEFTAPATGLRVRVEHLPLVRGEVVDARGLPLPWTEVDLWPAEARGVGPPLGLAQTDVTGHFSFRAPGPGRYRLSAKLFLRDVKQETSRELELGESGTQVALRMDAAHALAGTVVDASGQPLEGVAVDIVSALEPDLSHHGWNFNGETTDAEGHFLFPRVSGESLVLQFSRSPKRSPPHPRRIALTPGATEVRVVVDPN